MLNFEFPVEFATMSKFLFLDAEVAVKINGSPFSSFKIARRIYQGCPLAPYLFLLIAKVLNAMVRKEVEIGTVRGISLLFGNRQQVILKYADDTLFILSGKEDSVKKLVGTLEMFYLASGLELN